MKRLLLTTLILLGLTSVAMAGAMNSAMNTNGALNGIEASVDTVALDLSGVILAD